MKKFSFAKVTHYLYRKCRKMLTMGMFENKDSAFHSGP